MLLAPSFDDEKAIFAVCILRLVPLKLLVAHEAVFKVPVGGIGRPGRVEFVCPNQLPFRWGGDLVRGASLHQAQEEDQTFHIRAFQHRGTSGWSWRLSGYGLSELYGWNCGTDQHDADDRCAFGVADFVHGDCSEASERACGSCSARASERGVYGISGCAGDSG